MPLYALRLLRGTIKCGNFTILYQTSGTDCFVWKQNASSNVALTVFSGPSGSGKTMLLDAIYRRLRNDVDSHTPLELDFNPDLHPSVPVAVSYVPQNPPMVNHWKVKDLLPPTSHFFSSLFPDESTREKNKRVGHFSGGQKKKFYLCSALERLAAEDAPANFLLVDETLDGQGAVEAQRCLNALGSKWVEVFPNSSLHVLVVSHLNAPELIAINTAVKINLSVKENTSIRLLVEVSN